MIVAQTTYSGEIVSLQWFTHDETIAINKAIINTEQPAARQESATHNSRPHQKKKQAWVEFPSHREECRVPLPPLRDSGVAGAPDVRIDIPQERFSAHHEPIVDVIPFRQVEENAVEVVKVTFQERFDVMPFRRGQENAVEVVKVTHQVRAHRHTVEQFGWKFRMNQCPRFLGEARCPFLRSMRTQWKLFRSFHLSGGQLMVVPLPLTLKEPAEVVKFVACFSK